MVRFFGHSLASQSVELNIVLVSLENGKTEGEKNALSRRDRKKKGESNVVLEGNPVGGGIEDMEENEEGFSRKGKSERSWKKKRMNNEEPNFKYNRVEAKIGQQGDEKTKQRKRRSLNEAVGSLEGERLELSGEAHHPFKAKKVKPKNVTKPRVGLKKDENGFLESNMCHQCQRNDKGRVVRCTRCKTKRYCVPCMTTWYPKMSKEAFADACPFCQMNCNCKACLRMEAPVNARSRIWEKSDVKFSEDEKEKQFQTLSSRKDDAIRMSINIAISANLLLLIITEVVLCVPMTFASAVVKNLGMATCREVKREYLLYMLIMGFTLCMVGKDGYSLCRLKLIQRILPILYLNGNQWKMAPFHVWQKIREVVVEHF